MKLVILTPLKREANDFHKVYSLARVAQATSETFFQSPIFKGKTVLVPFIVREFTIICIHMIQTIFLVFIY